MLIQLGERLGAPVIALVEDESSPLARDAEVAIEMGRLEEACSLDLVPTTSTTAAPDATLR